jgi:transglutaminase-like putative cysteine protease
MSETQTVQEAPEDSKALRSVVFIMAVLCVASSSFFVRTDWWMTAAYLLLIVIGSFLSYKFRHNEPPWLKYIWWVGILLVGANGLHEVTGPLRDEFDFVSPFVHFLCGVFVFVTFSMKTRSDLNTASGLGLVLLCLSAPVAKGLPYGICIFGYLILGAVMMYYDCVSRTLSSWLSSPIIPAPEVQLQKTAGRRVPRGNTILLLTVVPLMALAMFIYVPRADEFLDKVWAYTKTMRIEYLTDIFYKAAAPPVSTEHRAHAGREWFNKNKEPEQLPMTGKYAPKSKEELEMEKQINEARKKAAVVEKVKRKPEKKAGTADSADEKKSKDKKNDKKKEAGKLVLNKQKSDEEKSKAEAGHGKKSGTKKPDDEKKPVTPPDEKLKEQAKKDADEQAPKDAERLKKEAAEEGAERAAKVKGKDQQADKGKAANKKAKSHPGKSDTKSGESKDGKDGKGDKNASGTGDGKNGGKTSAKQGKDGAGTGKNKNGAGDGGGGKKGRGKVRKKTQKELEAAKPPQGTPKAEPSIGGDNNLKVAGKSDDLDERLVLTVKSRRLVFLRRQVYDSFNGRVWKRSTPDKTAPKLDTVRVVDGEIKREQKIVQASRPNAGVIRKGGPVVMPTSPQQVIRGSQPSVFGNTNAQPSVLSANTSATEPIRVETPQPVQQANVTDDGDDDKKKKDEVVHPYVFEQTERPIFRVGMADALQIESTLPTVELVQEIKVKAKTIGVVVPGGWIEQEVKLPAELMRVDVDQFGIITAPKPLNKDMQIKVKTELPIYPIEAMRAELPLSAKVEDSLRDKYKRYLQLPGTVTEELFKLAEDNSDPRYNWFVQSQQICDYLRTNYEYDKMRDVNAESKDLVQDFLFDRKKGNCTDFASSFVVLTRCVGIPSRMVTGFSPGEWNQISGEQEVKMKHLHAWAEVFIPNFGWVPFDATPDGILPSQQRENRYSQKEVEKQLGLDKKNEFNIKATDVVAWFIAGIISLAVGVVAFKVLVALYRRWREGNMGRGPEWRLYKKVAKSIKKSMRLTRAPSETPTEFLERVKNVVHEQRANGKTSPEMLPEALETFLKTYSAVYFGKRTDELEHLKYHAQQVAKVTKNIKPTDIAVAEQKNAVRKKEKFDESSASSAVRRKK